MKLMFFDESKNDRKYPHYHIGAVCIDEVHLVQVEGKLTVLSQEVFGSSAPTRATEFHAAEIFHRSKQYSEWDFDKRMFVLSKLIDILSLEEVLLIDIQINCDNLNESQSADEIAFMFLCERANALVKSHSSLGMLIGDRESDYLADKFSSTLSEYRAHGTDFQFGQDIHNLVDSVHFTHSHLSRFLQSADVYSWTLQFRNRNSGSKSKYHAAVFEILERDGIDLFPSKYKEWPK